MKFGSILALNIAAITMIAGPMVSAQQEARQPDAQEETAFPEEAKVNLVDVFGDDPCPRSSADEIVVCSVYSEGDRYRIPQILRNDPNDPANQSWTQRAVAVRTLGASGINSCSPSGAGGFAGCTQSLIDAAFAERRNAPNVEAGRLISEERQKRLDLIDGEAEAVERRIVAFEQARAEKEAAEIEAANAEEAQLSADEKAVEAEGELPDLLSDQ